MSGPVLAGLIAVALLLQHHRVARHEPPRETWWLYLLVEVGFCWYAIAHRDPWLLLVAGMYVASYVDNLRLWRRDNEGADR